MIGTGDYLKWKGLQKLYDQKEAFSLFIDDILTDLSFKYLLEHFVITTNALGQ